MKRSRHGGARVVAWCRVVSGAFVANETIAKTRFGDTVSSCCQHRAMTFEAVPQTEPTRRDHEAPAATWTRPRVPRPRSRRHEPRQYVTERLSRNGIQARREHRAPGFVRALTDAGKTGSALRRALKANGMDPKMARLVLIYEGQASPRVADVAWMLGISPSTASRWLDRAERNGLVDKFYSDFDRRGTWTRLTRRGTAFRTLVTITLRAVATNDRPAGVVYGIRGSNSWDY